MIPAEVPNLVAGEERPPASGAWLDKARPADGDASLPRRAVGRGGRGRCGGGRAARRSRSGRRGRPSSAGDVVREIAELLRERREEASEIVAAETGKPLELALGETDAAVEMGFFVAGEGRRSYGRTTTAVDAAPHGADPAPAGRRRGAAHLLQHAAAERRLEGVPGDLLRQRGRC